MIDFSMGKDQGSLYVLDLRGAKTELTKQFKAELDLIKQKGREIVVTNDNEAKLAVEFIGNIKKFTKAIDARTKELTQEQDEYVKGVRQYRKMVLDEVNVPMQEATKKLNEYQSFIELERRKKEKLAREEAEKLKAEIEKEAKEAGVEVPEVIIQPVEQKSTSIRSENGSSSFIRKEWKCTEVIDINLVPREYLILDEKKVRGAIKAGIRQIDGLKIKEVPITVIRT